MNFLKISSVSFFIFFSLIISSPAMAAGTTTPTVSTQRVVTLSKVNVQNLKIDSQSGSLFKISFNAVNHGDAQAGLKYSVRLIKEVVKGQQFIADEKDYPESFSVGANSSIHKTLSYEVPVNLTGNYSILVLLKNTSGLPLGMGVVGKINFHPNPNPTALTNTVQILPETCYLSVVGEKNSPKYTLIQGVDIASTESLSLTCSVVSPLKTISSVVPTYETHYRDISGEVVTQEGGDVSPISFKALEKKLITLLLPKATKPQAYDIKTTLISNGISSNSIISHYVLRGESATIQTFSIDKDYYKVNDIAKLSVVWTPSADNFIGSRLSKSGTALPSLTLTGTINDDKQQACISPINQVVTDSKVDISIPIITNCNNPQASIQLKDAKGNVLDQKTLSFKTNIQTAAQESNTMMIFIIIGVLIVAGLAVYFIILKKKSNETNIQ